MGEPTAAASDPPPKRALGFWMCLALVVGNIIGSGVFLLPAALAPYGPNAILGWMLTIGGALCLAFVIASLSRAIPGGPYAYALTAFGELPAFLVMWSFTISIWVSLAALSIAAVSYLSLFAPGIAAVPGLPAALAVGFVWLFTVINISGVRAAGTVQIVTTVLKLLPLIAVIVIGCGVMIGEREAVAAAANPVPISSAGIAATAALTLWAMLGFESAALSHDKVADLGRVIPRATIAGTLIAGLVYLLACSAIIFLLPVDQTANSAAPFADFVERYWARGPALFVALFAAISALGALNGWVLLEGEVPLTMARAGVFPRWFGITNALGTPVRGLIIGSMITTVIVAMNYTRTMTDLFVFMALLATVATLVLYFACATAALVLIGRGALRSRRLTAIAVLGTLYSLWAIYGAGADAVGWGAVLLATGLPVWWLMRAGAARLARAASPSL